ncbi:MAG: ATP-binding protein [Collinsella sp.]
MNNPTAISLVVSCDPDLARLVRMTAANVATLSSMSVECVEDIRMAAEEAFIYACATSPDETLTIDFDVDSTRVAMTFTLEADAFAEPSADDPDCRVRRFDPRLRLRCLSEGRDLPPVSCSSEGGRR